MTLVAPPDTRSPTGIPAYVEALRQRAPPDLDLQVRHLPKAELVVAGKRLGGTLSTWAALAAIRPGWEAGLLHATDTFCLVAGSRVATVHDLIPARVSRHLGARLHQRLFRRRLANVETVITPTRHVAREVEAELGIPASRLVPIHQGFDPARFYPSQGPRDPALAEGRPNLLYVGAYRSYKRIDAVLSALKGIECRFVRAGPPGKDAYHAQCLRAARDNGVDLVDVGFVDDSRLRALYTGCDLVVYPSRDEGFGIPPLEAMACGTASLLSDIPVFREVYGELAHYVPSFDASALREGIERALSHRLPASALRTHAAAYTWDKTAHATFGVYRRLLGLT